jgi:adenylate kinase
MRIFINNVDSYVGKALCADLRQCVPDKENRLIGTLTKDGGEIDMELLGTMGVRRIVSRKDRRQYLQDILSCSLIVFDLHSANLDDAEEVMKQLKIAKLEKEVQTAKGETKKEERNVVFVLISSVMVWAKTKNDRVPIQEEDEEEEAEAGDEDENAPPKIKRTRPKEMADADLDRRTPEQGSVYETWKYLENLALSLSSKEGLRPHVVCAGTLYGNGETTFNDLFKEAWLTRATHSIIEPGDNYLPCVHVRDLSRLARVVVQNDKVGPYLVAVDKARLTQAQIVQGIVNRMATAREVPVRPEDEVQSEFKDVMKLDLIMQPSAPMRSKEFPWWCKSGIVDNITAVADEFTKWRNLRPLKMIVNGPPGSGAERFCRNVADRYLHEDPPLLTFESIVNDVLNATDANGEPTKAARILRRKVKRAQKKPGGKLPMKVRTKLVRERLLSNVCRFRGYVLEGYPQSAEEAEALFTEIEYPEGEEPPPEEEEEEPEEGAEEEEEEEEAPPPPAEEEEEADDAPKRILSKAITPEFVVELASSLEKCKARIFSGQARGPSSEEEFVRLMKEYSSSNLAEDGRLRTSDFFEETANVKVLKADVDTCDETEVFHAIRVYLEAKGQFFNYLKSEEDRVRDVAVTIASGEEEKDAQREKELADTKAKEARRKDDRGQEEAARIRLLAESEAQLLDNETAPLRQYLMINVVPTLTEGLMEVCKVSPEDPIEYLSEYLFAHAQDIQAQLQDENL